MDFIPDRYIYLLINVLTIAYPLAQSYEKRIRLLQHWKAIFTSIAITGAVFLAWDELFTQLEVWGFNGRYLTGIYIGALPIEEWGFFLTVPFACIFVYEVLNYFIKKDIFANSHQAITLFFLMVTTFLGYYFHDRMYTSTSFFFAAILLLGQLMVFRFSWMGRFYMAYFVCLIPFLIMNGWLTGSFTDEPIVWYNNLENMGLRIFTIPAEDTIYLLGMLLLTFMVYEKVKVKP
ncbi:MAG: lycopene cyclase domain-containing protein [Salibacteraceae bacterium]|nr:lycopene cyclase domain-containing protein [Salibacteraceae bacterium]